MNKNLKIITIIVIIAVVIICALVITINYNKFKNNKIQQENFNEIIIKDITTNSAIIDWDKYVKKIKNDYLKDEVTFKYSLVKEYSEKSQKENKEVISSKSEIIETDKTSYVLEDLLSKTNYKITLIIEILKNNKTIQMYNKELQFTTK